MQAHNRTGGYREEFRSAARLLLWTLAWVGTVALASFGPNLLWDDHAVVSWVAVALNLAAGIGWIIAHARFLREIDELQRKIMQDALVVTLGVGWVVGFAYVVAHTADLVDRSADVGVFSVLLAVVYMLAIAAGQLRYR